MTAKSPVRIDPALLDHYLAGECTPAERVVVESWLVSHSERQSVVDALCLGAPVNVDVGLNLRRVRDAMDRETRARKYGEFVEPRPRMEGVHGRTRQWGFFKAQTLRAGRGIAVAGIALGVTILAIGWRMSASDRAHTPKSFSTYVTESGQRANITLPDGNIVALNVASRLDVPADYSSGNHTVHLLGEALFTVTHHAGTPFTVIAGAATVRVLGTSFAVRHYAADTSARVAVREGKVVVGSTTVAAGQLVEIGRRDMMRQSSADLEDFSFATGILVLHGRRLADAIPQLNRWYDVDIRLNDGALKDKLVDATLTMGSLSDLVSILELSYNARVVRDGRVLTLSPR